jgi:hypothetical protein
MFALTRYALRTLAAFSGHEEGLVKTERSLLTGCFVMLAITILVLLGVDIAGWFGIEPPVEEDA